jgi:hypothetical protein
LQYVPAGTEGSNHGVFCAKAVLPIERSNSNERTNNLYISFVLITILKKCFKEALPFLLYAVE